MRAHFGLPSVEAEDKEGKPPISVKFEIPYFTTSGIQVRARVCRGPEQTWTTGTQSWSRPRGLQVIQQHSQLREGLSLAFHGPASPRAPGPRQKEAHPYWSTQTRPRASGPSPEIHSATKTGV